MRLPFVLSIGLAAVASLLPPGCATVPSDDGHRYSNGVEEQGDRRVGEYISSQWSFHTASYWIEGPEGLVLIDTQFVPSALTKEVRYAERLTGKKAALAIVLHPNPDRFNGTRWIGSTGVPVVTSEQVRALIPAVHRKWVPVFFEKYRPSSYPWEPPEPESFGASTRELHAGGLTLNAHVLGAGVSPAHVVVEWEGHLFVGDLITSGSHGWFEDGRIPDWRQRLEELRALHPRWVHPGHGMTGGPELIDRQLAYLDTVSAAVAEEHPRGRSTPEALARISAHIGARYPAYGGRPFLDRILSAEWARQAALAAVQSATP